MRTTVIEKSIKAYQNQISEWVTRRSTHKYNDPEFDQYCRGKIESLAEFVEFLKGLKEVPDA